MPDTDISALYGNRTASELTADEKRLVSSLVTIAGGLAGAGVSGGNLSMAALASNTARVEVENNSLGVPDNKARAQEMAQCRGGAACENAVINKYKKINAEQHESVVGCKGAQDCVNKANEVGELQADYARRTSELLEKSRIDGGLSPAEQDELAVLQVTTIQLEADRNAAIHNALMSGDSSEAKQLAINSLAQVAGTSAAGIAAGVGKGGKGSSLPTPTTTSAANGLNYQSNPKHTPGQQGYSFNAGTEPKNAIDLFGASVTSGKKRYSIDSEGNVHQFTNTNDGTWHWSGSTGDKTVPLKKNDIPNSVKKEFGLPGKWR
ncbi:VENN motif pre-toxin domain-containing protein [Lelliottia sp. RWM.1]|uniref:VENN motif pre-toxin domain-containing protein n=1 Tax=Lelliottia sp. RWM.1 TaxID=2663242 RepID=UPI001EF031B3|nr:VENN motif pre-toxin domain-containing protein [Lelliottia sp. RWM.1]